MDKEYMKATKVNKELCKIISIEELSELTKELTKDIRGKTNKKDIIEEIADVRICINWLMEIYKISEKDFNEMYNKKCNRIVDRINNNNFK